MNRILRKARKSRNRLMRLSEAYSEYRRNFSMVSTSLGQSSLTG
jgi:hypothetical protein